MITRTKNVCSIANRLFTSLLATAVLALSAGAVHSAPDISQFVVPSTVHQLTATARTISADQSELAKINKDFGDAYRLHEVTYRY
ncbi:MAG TPA: hypothetical protein VFW40_03110, partial [Capsulimonadaceae bacterium]|nr:hypothetical protein [Capsulimonadaceae bacterium]